MSICLLLISRAKLQAFSLFDLIRKALFVLPHLHLRLAPPPPLPHHEAGLGPVAFHGAEETEEWVSRELQEEQAVELGSAVTDRVSIALGR